MKRIILLPILLFNLVHVQNVTFSIPADQHEIFLNYKNGNFSQNLAYDPHTISAAITSKNPLDLNLNYRIFLDKTYTDGLQGKLKDAVLHVFIENEPLGKYFQNISKFLREKIQYTEHPLPQDSDSVAMSGKANCIGFSNLLKSFLESVNLKHRFVKGFFLKKDNGNTFEPIPHRWLEIELANGKKFFYDPQYQNFSANYLVIKEKIDFKEIRKFKVNLVKKTKKIAN